MGGRYWVGETPGLGPRVGGTPDFGLPGPLFQTGRIRAERVAARPRAARTGHRPAWPESRRPRSSPPRRQGPRGDWPYARRHLAGLPALPCRPRPAQVSASRGRTRLTPLGCPLTLLWRTGGKRLLEPPDHGRLYRRGRRPHELAHFLELVHDGLALY